jgi:RNA polymerase sigma-70 factor (ECF subfamily)
MDDKERALIERVLNGDLDAFEPLITPYRQPLLSLAYRITRNWEDAKETSQETFLRAFKYLGKVDVRRSFRNWIYQILINTARHLKNKQAVQDRLRLDLPVDKVPTTSSEGNPEEHQLDQELRSQLMDCLDGLTDREKEVFLLRDIEGLNIKESAHVLGCSSVSIRVHLSAARRKIQERIKEKYPSLLEVRR